MDKREMLKSMLHNIINDKKEEASLDLHNYLTSKMKEVSGISAINQFKQQDQDLDLEDGFEVDDTAHVDSAEVEKD